MLQLAAGFVRQIAGANRANLLLARAERVHAQGEGSAGKGLWAQTGIEPSPQNDLLTVDYSRVVASVEETDWQIGLGKLCPRLCPNGCAPSTNTVTYGETPRDISRG